jgi:oxalate---CoA ligase
VSELSVQLRNRLRLSEDPIINERDHWYSVGDVVRDIHRIHAVLRQMNVQVGDRIVLAQPNSYAFIVSYLSLLLYGATVVPLNPKMPKPEMDAIIGRSASVGAFVHHGLNEHFLNLETSHNLRFIASFTASAPEAVQLALVENRQGTWVEFYGLDSLYETAVSETAAVNEEPAESTPAVLLFTSGTTGSPKGVMLTHRQVMATARNVAVSHRLSKDDISYCFLPLFHINAQVVAVLSTFITGGKLVVEEKFSASKFWPTVAKHRVTWASAVPTVIAILLKTPKPQSIPTSMRFIRSASAPLPAAQAKLFEEWFGIPVIESYGLTEAASQVCVNPLPPEEHRFGSVGRPVGIELKIVDEQGVELLPRQVGEIVIRGESVITEYAYGDATGSSFHDGWFHTGDLGYIDEDGFVFITGRSKEMINRAGQKISPREVEEVILRHPHVKMAAVIGLPDELYGERVAAYIISEVPAHERDDSVLIEEIRQLCLSSISAYKCPAEFHIVDEIPVGVTGKIQRYRLRQQVLETQNSN